MSSCNVCTSVFWHLSFGHGWTNKQANHNNNNNNSIAKYNVPQINKFVEIKTEIALNKFHDLMRFFLQDPPFNIFRFAWNSRRRDVPWQSVRQQWAHFKFHVHGFKLNEILAVLLFSIFSAFYFICRCVCVCVFSRAFVLYSGLDTSLDSQWYGSFLGLCSLRFKLHIHEHLLSSFLFRLSFRVYVLDELWNINPIQLYVILRFIHTILGYLLDCFILVHCCHCIPCQNHLQYYIIYKHTDRIQKVLIWWLHERTTKLLI